MPEKMKVGFIGLGHMGCPMASCILKAGYELTVYDICGEAAQGLEAQGAVRAGNPKEVAIRSEVVVTSLPGPVDVETVVLGEGGVFAGLSEGEGFIDTSTNAPATMRKISEIGESRGIYVLDAPVSGGVFGAKDGTLSVFVGGQKEDYDRYLCLLRTIGDTVVHMGPTGSGNVTKLVNNTIMFINFLGACEGMAMGFKAGIDPQTLLSVIKPSMGQSIILERVIGLWLEGREMASTADLAVKDMQLGVALGHELGIPMELGLLVQSMIERFEDNGNRSKEDMIAYVEDAMERAGVEGVGAW